MITQQDTQGHVIAADDLDREGLWLRSSVMTFWQFTTLYRTASDVVPAVKSPNKRILVEADQRHFKIDVFAH